MRIKTTVLITALLIFIPSIYITSCLFLPKTVPDEEDQECLLVTKSMTIDYYTSPDMIDEAVDEMANAIKSDCHEPECLLLFAPLIAISVGSFIVSGSIVVVGNTIHWIEEQGRCDDSVTRKTLTEVINSAKKLGGTVITTCSELIEWFKKQASYSGQPDEDLQEIEE
jgi:hypothetical protein